MTVKKKKILSQEKYMKPKIEIKELSLHSLLGENGWYNVSTGKVLALGS